MQSFVEYNLALQENMNSFTLTNYILLSVNHDRERQS
jgi:hypothetical protein